MIDNTVRDGIVSKKVEGLFRELVVIVVVYDRDIEDKCSSQVRGRLGR
jgi:hypothetical protein